ncbi:Hypothetical protein CINCED_3A023705 [Cinara cedri]|nr:Hypothetical protein CINCED_3A023705 [Cinara cedri]
MEIVVPKVEHSINAHKVASELQLSSSNDEFLLEAISQVELIENNLNSSIFHSVSREETPSPVMDLTETIQKASDLQETSNKVTYEMTREDTPSPTLHFGSPLSHKFSITNNKPIDMFQSPGKTNTNDIREDTPSPLTNLEHFDDSNILSTLDVNNHNILLDNEYTSKLDEFDETQILDSTQKLPTTGILTTSKITQLPKHLNYLNNQPERTEIKELNVADESTQVPFAINKDDSFHCQPQNVSTKGDKSNLLEVQIFGNVCTSEPNNCQLNEIKVQTIDLGDKQVESTIKTVPTLKITNLYSNTPKNEFKISTAQPVELVDQNSLNCHAKLSPTSKHCYSSISMSQLAKQKQNITENNFNTLKADDDDFFFYTAQKVESSINNSYINTKSNFNSIVICEDSNYNKNKLFEEKNQQDDKDFFNCPTQKLFIPKKNITTTKPSTTNVSETQTFSQFQQTSKTNKKNSSSDEGLTKLQEMDDDDFFNCPTQKLSISKKNITTAETSTINNEKTQQIPQQENEDFFNCPTQKLSISKKNITTAETSTINKEKTQQIPQQEDEDFFNCPTQKLSIPKNNIITTKPSTINESETQIFLQFQQTSKTNKKNSNSNEGLTKLQEMDDDDFFNCPTQKLSIPKNNIITTKPSTINESETQMFLQFQQTSKTNKKNSNSNEGLTKLQEMDDDDFFNCPTQKLSISKKNITTAETSTINNEKTQQIPQQEDEDFFNCPTQKLSIPKKNIPTTINELETQTFSQFQQINKSIKINSSIPEDLTQSPEIDENSLNHLHQNISITTKQKLTKLSTAIKKEEFKKCSESNKTSTMVSNNICTSNILENLTQILEMHDNVHFDCPIVPSVKSESFMNSQKKNLNDQDINEIKIVNSTVQSNISVISNGTKNLVVDQNLDITTNQKQTMQIDNINKDSYQKPSFVVSNSKNNLDVLSPKMCIKNNSLENKKKNEKPIICVRKDLLKSPESSNNKYLRSTNKSIILNKTVRLANENIDLPSSSKIVNNSENGLNVLSFKQESLTGSFVECQAPKYLKFKHQSKHMNESILYSPLNVPNLNTDLTLDHQSTVIAIQDKVGTSNSESASSNNSASQWKSLKMDKQNRGKMGNKENFIENKNENISVKKERYQTRAIAKKENSVELSRKRKHDGKSVDENNKKKCDENVKNVPIPLIHRTLETVVTFSYLRNREMKEFVEKTGGSVTDDITQCTVLVSDKIRCTMKILSAIGRGCPIVSANWVKHSYVVRVFEEIEEFITVDKDAERKYNFQLKESLAKARANKLLKGYTVLVTPSVKPGPKDMKVIITCAGGNYVVNWPKSMGQKNIIVTCNQDRNQWKAIWNNDKAKIIDSDTLITSIIRQKLIV